MDEAKTSLMFQQVQCLAAACSLRCQKTGLSLYYESWVQTKILTSI